MGSYDPAQIVDLIGIYILDKWGSLIDIKQVALCRDDDLTIIPDRNDPKTSKQHKNIITAFK